MKPNAKPETESKIPIKRTNLMHNRKTVQTLTNYSTLKPFALKRIFRGLFPNERYEVRKKSL